MTVKFLNGDARQLIRTVVADSLITDPVWPNCPPELLVGWENPAELLGDVLAAAPACIRRLVIILRSDSDPRFLAAVPKRWKFVCVQAMSYAVPMYLGRVPRSKFPALALIESNLQVLCKRCNHGKSNKDETDWRYKASPELIAIMKRKGWVQ